MDKFKICPVCGMKNSPSMLECSGCEADLISVKITDKSDMNTEEKIITKADSDGIVTADDVSAHIVQEEYVRVCECGCLNPAVAKKCTGCGEIISDIAPVKRTDDRKHTYVLESLDGKYTFEIMEGETAIGREHEMREYLADKFYISREHAKLIRQEGKVYIENLSRTNYTFINNERIHGKVELNIDDEIGLGGNETDGKRQSGAAYFKVRSQLCI